MAKDRNGSLPEEERDGGEEKNHHKRSKKRKEISDGEHGGSIDEKERVSTKKRKRGKHGRSRRSSRRSRGSSSEGEPEEDSFSSASYSDSSAEDSNGASESDSLSDSDESEEEVRRRKRRERRRKERKHEKERRRKEERRRKKAKEEKRKEEKRRKKKKKEKDLGKKGAVTNSWGKYGIIRETEMWNKRPEFTAWLAEVKKVNLESLANWEEKQMFKEFMEDHNTATFPSKKYYDLDAYHRRMMAKEMKKGSKKAAEIERTVFNDEEVRRQELLIERERQKDEQVEALKRSMQSGMAQAMKEQAQLKEEMAYQYKLGNFEAAAAIQKRLDPDVAM
uniref:Protein split ends n=1 Tax=Anthurium amnicola TaxID=1678845 RepID=A0A1D1XXJ5_9ARAE